MRGRLACAGLLLLGTLSCKREAPRAVSPETPGRPVATPESPNAPARPERLRLTAWIAGITERDIPVEFPGAVEWQNSAEPSPAARYLVQPPDIVGTWARFNGDDGTILGFTRAADGLLNVDFETGGHLGGWRLKRRARYERGVVILNLPVREYLPQEYRKLYAVRVLGRDYLVSAEAASHLQELEKDLKTDPESWMAGFYVFSRQAQSGAP